MRLSSTLSVAMLALLTFASKTQADVVSNAATSCRSVSTGAIKYTPYLGNDSDTSPLHVVCPLSLNDISYVGGYFSQVIVRYKDVSTTDPFYCWTESTPYNGNTVAGSITKFACSQPGGCDDNTYVSETGQGNYLLLDVARGGIWIDDSFALHCNIPKRSGVGQLSGLYVYYVQ